MRRRSESHGGGSPRLLAATGVMLAFFSCGVTKCDACHTEPAVPADCALHDSAYMDVKYERQQGNFLCWAAGVQMALAAQDRTVTQCTQAMNEIRRCKCDDGSIPRSCDKARFPNVKPYGFRSDRAPWLFSWDFARAELSSKRYGEGCGERPFLFTWQWWRSSTTHLIIADGFEVSEDRRFVWTMDPQAPCEPFVDPVLGEIVKCDENRSLMLWEFFGGWKSHHTGGPVYYGIRPAQE